MSFQFKMHWRLVFFLVQFFIIVNLSQSGSISLPSIFFPVMAKKIIPNGPSIAAYLSHGSITGMKEWSSNWCQKLNFWLYSLWPLEIKCNLCDTEHSWCVHPLWNDIEKVILTEACLGNNCKVQLIHTGLFEKPHWASLCHNKHYSSSEWRHHQFTCLFNVKQN